MDITVIHGQNHKGSTYHITKKLLDKIYNPDNTVHEFFMPKDAPDFCCGCLSCILKGEEHCPHYKAVHPIIDAMEKSQLIIVDTPTYVFEMSGQLKTLFDHMAYMWMLHKPRMFNKTAVLISTAAGAGTKNVVKSLKRQMLWLGISKTYSIRQNVQAGNWAGVSEENRKKIDKKVNKVSEKLLNSDLEAKANFKLKFLFLSMRMLNKKVAYNKTDTDYWKENGWLENKRPWN